MEKIKCPHCGTENETQAEFCWKCYKKIDTEKPSINHGATPQVDPAPADRPACPVCSQADTDTGHKTNGKSVLLPFYGRLVVVIGLFLFYLQWLREEKHFSFIDNVNLAFHEAGHIIFGFFGEFITTLGGTINQILMPFLCMAYFLRKNNRFAWQICLFWLGENFFHISIYVADAIKQELPLVGGGVHDWTYLLTEMGLIHKPERVAKFVFGVGSIIIFCSLYFIIRDAFKALKPPLNQGNNS